MPSYVRRTPVRASVFLLLVGTFSGWGMPGPVWAQSPDHPAPDRAYAAPPPIVEEFFGRDPGFAVLDHPSPDGRHFLVPHSTELSTLERMGERTLRLAELEIRPRTDRLWHLDTFGIHAFSIYSLEDRAFRRVELPSASFASDFMWSPDGSRLAYLLHGPDGTEVWTVSATGGDPARLSDARVIATVGTGAAGQGSRPSRMLQWTDRGSVLALVVPRDRGPEPARAVAPAGPIIRVTREEPTPTPTFPNLLRDDHDAALFTHYTRSQIVELAGDRPPRPLGEPAIWETLELSPDGRHLMAVALDEPFSFITSHQGFPRRRVVMDLDGRVLSTLEERPLREARGGGDAGTGEPRDWRWRPDGAGITYLVRDEEGGDRVVLLPPPFDTARAQTVIRSADPIRDLHQDLDGRHALATVTRDGKRGIVAFTLPTPPPNTGGSPSPEQEITPVTAGTLIADFHDPDDPLALPGEVLTARNGNGVTSALTASDGSSAYLQGQGYREDFRPRPFVDRVDLATGTSTRIFEGASDFYERPLAPLDRDLDRLVVSREGKNLFPDSHLWSSSAGFQENLTGNRNPFPELAAARREDFSFTRQDGLTVQGRISLPVDYVEGSRVPAIFWTYPREYTEPEGYERAAIRARNHNAFTQLTWLRWSELWLTQGYALVDPDIPIVGENYNDTYVASMVDAMYAAVRAVDRLGYVDPDRIGHGGHSYGAFATVNFLAHTPFFKAGIAGHGAYNRSLTPAGFQSERRILWEAPHTYLDISPFFKADQINAPLLMYHGGDDNNTGTWPIQSERLMHALTTLGKTAVLYIYPYESHTPRAIENNLDMWARWLDWFDHYVKGEDRPAT